METLWQASLPRADGHIISAYTK